MHFEEKGLFIHSEEKQFFSNIFRIAQVCICVCLCPCLTFEIIDTRRKLVFTKTLLYFENIFQKCYPIGMIQRHWKRSDKKKIFLDLNSIPVGEYFI